MDNQNYFVGYSYSLTFIHFRVTYFGFILGGTGVFNVYISN